MSWLSQNWLLIAMAVGIIYLMPRMGCGGGHRHSHHSDGEPEKAGSDSSQPQQFDPVSGHWFSPAASAPIASVHQGQTYYFESRENREAFEAAPEKFAAIAREAGVRPQEHRPHRHHHGC